MKIIKIKLYPCITNKEIEFQVNKISIELRNIGLNVINKIIIGIPIKKSRPQYYHDNKQTINDKQKQKRPTESCWYAITLPKQGYGA